MDFLSLREREIFESLRELDGLKFAIIGGYAVNAYALPRFSVDCDLVMEDNKEAEKIVFLLQKRGYSLIMDSGTAENYGGAFLRMAKILGENFKASFDLLIREVRDRRTGASFSAEWIFSHSRKRRLPGKTFPEFLDARVIDIDALIVLKLTASRRADLRDVFMLLPSARDFGFIRKEVSEKTDMQKALKRAAETILSEDFKKNLGGVYGFLDERVYQRHVSAFRRLMIAD